MADSKKNPMWLALTALASLAAGAGGRHAIGAAQAQSTAGAATYEQVEKLDKKLDALGARVLAVELEQAKQQGAQSAVHRERR